MQSLLFRFKKLYYRYLTRQKNLPPVIQDHLRACFSLNLRQPIADTDFSVFDTETTGLHARKGDRIVSISAVRIRQGRIDLADSFHELVNPDRDIPPRAVVIHGILPRMVNGKPAMEEILPKFIEYIGSSVLVAHHAWLDMTFLNREMERLYGFSLQSLVLDTADLDHAFYLMKGPDSGQPKANNSLKALAERYRVLTQGQHTSFGDALTTAQIFQRMLKEAQKRGVLSLKDLLRKAYQPVSFHP